MKKLIEVSDNKGAFSVQEIRKTRPNEYSKGISNRLRD